MALKNILAIFKFMGFMFKSNGLIPLTRIYENERQSARSATFFNVLLPIFSYVMDLLFSSIQIYYCLTLRHPIRNVVDLFSDLEMIIVSSWFIVAPFYLFFRVSPRLVTFFKDHRPVDVLLRPKRRRITTFVNLSFLIISALSAFQVLAYVYIRQLRLQLVRRNIVFVNVLAGLSALYNLNLRTQPLILYIAVQHVLRSGFDQLTSEIKSVNGSMNLGLKMKKLKQFGRMHFTLCRLSKDLDQMMSPLMAFRYLIFFILTTYYFMSMSTTGGSKINFVSILMILNPIIFLFFLPVIAQSTTDAALKVAPAIYLQFNADDKNMKNELEIISLRFFYYKPSFTASGLFKLNGETTLAVLESIISYSVLFFKISNNI